MPKVNKDYVKDLLENQKPNKKGAVDVDAMMKDNRFGALFNDKDFVIDK